MIDPGLIFFVGFMKVINLIISLVILIIIAETKASVGPELEQLTQNLLKLRQEVELANTSLQSKKEELDQKLKNQGMNLADLENQIKREQQKLKQTEEKKTNLIEKMQLSQQNTQEYSPLIEKVGNELTQYINKSLPFARSERLESLKELQKKHSIGRYSDIQMLTQLWQFLEDESRLAKENALSQQIVQRADGQQQLELAKVGMWQLYYRAPNGEVGIITIDNGKDHYQAFEDSHDQKQVIHFMDSLRKNIRMGQFDLPVTLETEAL